MPPRKKTPEPTYETGEAHGLPPLDVENPGDALLVEQFEETRSVLDDPLDDFAPQVGVWDQQDTGALDDPQGLDPRSLPGSNPFNIQGRASSPPIWRDAQKFSAATALRVWRLHNGRREICGTTRHANVSVLEVLEQFLDFMPQRGDPPLTLMVRPLDANGQEFGTLATLEEIPWQNTDLQEVRRRKATVSQAQAQVAGYSGGHGVDPMVAQIMQEMMRASATKELAIMEELRLNREAAAKREKELAELEIARQTQTMRAQEAITERVMNSESVRAAALLEQQQRAAAAQIELQGQMHKALMEGQGGLSAAMLAMTQTAMERDRAAAEARARDDQARFERERRDMEMRLERDRAEQDRREAQREAQARREQEDRQRRDDQERARLLAETDERQRRMEREAKAEADERQRRHDANMLAMKQEHEARMKQDTQLLELQMLKLNQQTAATTAASPLGLVEQARGLLEGFGLSPAALLQKVFAPPPSDEEPGLSASALVAELAPHVGGMLRGIGDVIQKARVPVAVPAHPAMAALPAPVPAIPFPGAGIPGGAMVLGDLPGADGLPTPVQAQVPVPAQENQALSALPLAMKRDARTSIRNLVNTLRNAPEDQWTACVIGAVQDNQATYYHYLKANGGITLSLREAGADDAFIQRFLSQPAMQAIPEDVPR